MKNNDKKNKHHNMTIQHNIIRRQRTTMELLTNAPLFATPNSNPKNTKIVLKISSYLHMARFLGPLFYLTFFWIFFLKHLYKPQFYVGMRQIRLQKKTTHIYRKHPISEQHHPGHLAGEQALRFPLRKVAKEQRRKDFQQI